MALLCISLAVYNVEYFKFAYWSFDDLWRNVLKPSAPLPSFPFICCCGDWGHKCLVVVLMVFIRDHTFTVFLYILTPVLLRAHIVVMAFINILARGSSGCVALTS